MVKILCFSLFVCGLNWCYGVSTKMDFESDDAPTSVETNLTKADDQDVEVKHTIVVSTKLRNNNRRGLYSNNGGESPSFKTNSKEPKGDSGEVPIVNGYKSIESTIIRTPDTRPNKHQQGSQLYPDSVFINRNINDQYDIYPNYVNNPTQWKPSTQYNNINWLREEVPTFTEYNSGFINTLSSRPAYQTPGKFHRRVTDDGMKEFYCKKCAELQGFKGCAQARSNPWTYTRETTTPRVKIDGKLAKLN